MTFPPWRSRRRIVSVIARALALVVVLGSLSCDHSRRNATVRRWLLCIECIEGELSAVVHLRDAAVPILKESLRGPSPEESTGVALRIGREFEETKRWTSRHPTRGDSSARQLLPDSSTYVQTYVVNYIEKVQGRSAIALAAIDSDKARGALRKVWQTDSIRLQPIARRLVDSLVQTFNVRPD